MAGPLQEGDPRRVGRYRVLGRLGAGGMGVVYLGRSPAGAAVAIKLVHAGFAADPGFRARFAREAAVARTVGGAFTAPVIDADPHAPSPWLVTAYLPGLSLADAVAEHGPLPAPSVFALGASLAEALVAVHRAGIVHRDLKPANVMLAPDGPRLIDFGIAHAADAAELTRTGGVMGSPGFLAPEQARGGTTGPASDVFALGAVLTYAAAGEGPFGSGDVVALLYRVVHDPPRLDGVVDAELRALLSSCLDKDPARRPTPRSLLERFVPRAPAPEVLHGTGWLPEPVARRVADRTLPLPSRSRRRFLALGWVAGAGTVAAAVTGVVLLDGSGGGRKATVGTSASPSASVSPSPVLAQPMWTVELGTDPYGGVRPAGNSLIVAADQGRLICLDVRTRKTVWQQRKGARGASAASWRTPVVAGGTLFVGWPDSPGVLYAFDLRKGDRLWSTTAAGQAMNPTVSDGVLYAGDADGLYAVSAVRGELLWRAPIGNAQNCTPGVDGGLVFAGTVAPGNPTGAGNALHALDARTGAERWKHPMPGGGHSPAAAGGLVHSSDGHGTMTALDARTGAKKWDFVGGQNVSDPFVSGGVLYVADASGKVYGLDAASGATRWTWPSDTQGLWMAGVSRGVLVAAAGTEVFGLDAAGGRPLWRTGPLEKVRTVAVQGDAVYVGIEAGTLFAFPVKGA